MPKPINKLVRFLGWLILICGLLFTIMFFFMLIEKSAPTSNRIIAIVFMAISMALTYLGFRITRFRKKQEKEAPEAVNTYIKLETENSDNKQLNNKQNNPASVNVIHKGMNSQNANSQGKVDYKPLLRLCAEIGNSAENNYIPFEPPIPMKIVYCDKYGEITERDIDVNYIAKSDWGADYYFDASCHLRNEKRTFNVERIQQAIVDGNTVDFIQYIVNTYRNTNKYKKTLLAIKTRKILYSDDFIGHCAVILTYIARIDGTFTRKEKTQIAAFLKELAVDYPDVEIENYIDELAYLTPTTPEYKTIVKKVAITESLVSKAKEITGKDPLRLGAFEILNKQYEKNITK
jgi:hypothetical protein